MEIIADFHIHSKYSRATSQDMDLEHLYFWAKRKGVNLLGTGDFTHPAWLKELKEKLIPAEEGLYKFKNQDNDFFFRFIITGEISLVYSFQGKIRKIHYLLILPNLETAEKINTQLSWLGNLSADGRPILGINSQEFLKIILSTSREAILVPAHIWTPWFGIFGSKSGFNSLEECFGNLSQEIFSMETGLSADPAMCWRLSSLDRITLISNSDAHSPKKIAREANVFEIEKEKINFSEIRRIIKEKDRKSFLLTIEFYPEEGKYHFDGHRQCQVSFSPKETKKYNGLCPVCQRPLTIGVLSRVEELADREENFLPKDRIPFKKIVLLEEIITQALQQSSLGKEGEMFYNKLIDSFGNEMNVLLKSEIKEIEKITLPEIAQGIEKVRKGEVFIQPGFDGQFGKISLWQLEEKEKKENFQSTLF